MLISAFVREFDTVFAVSKVFEDRCAGMDTDTCMGTDSGGYRACLDYGNVYQQCLERRQVQLPEENKII